MALKLAVRNATNFPSVLRVYRDLKDIRLFGNVVLLSAVSSLD